MPSFALDGPNAEVLQPASVLPGEEAAEEVDGDALVLGLSPAEAAAAVRSHPATTAEIRQLCGDLQVLGRSEFKALLKWCVQQDSIPQCPRFLLHNRDVAYRSFELPLEDVLMRILLLIRTTTL